MHTDPGTMRPESRVYDSSDDTEPPDVTSESGSGAAPGAAADAKPDAPDQAKKPSVAGSVFNLVMLVVGAIALWWMLRTTSWAEMRGVIADVGYFAIIVLGLDLFAMCLDAAAWHAFMRPEARMVPYWRVLGAWASGRAINVLTPFGALGEATKVTMLLAHAPRARVLSSIVLLNVAMVYLSVTVMLIGIPITILMVDLPDALKVTIGIGLAVIIPAVIGLGVAIHRGAMATLIGALARTRLISRERAADWKTRLADVDRHIRELHRNRSAGTWTGFLFVLGSKVVNYTSTFMLIYAVGVPMTPTLMVAVVSVGVLIQWISSIVPLRLGLEDGGNYAMYELLGFEGTHGLFVTLLNRGRSFTVAMIGLVIMAVMSVLDRLARRRIKSRLEQLRADRDD